MPKKLDSRQEHAGMTVGERAHVPSRAGASRKQRDGIEYEYEYRDAEYEYE
jgi:hypothetical protein